jgi:CRISPR/Cas system-associated exonuclease Cas4 (RecB family)
MRILCSAGLGEMDQEECLACARTGNGKCGFDYIVLKAIYGHDNERPDVHVTDLTGCLRKAFYSKTEKVALEPHKLYTMSLGTMVHAGLEGSDEFVDSELVVSTEGIVGRADVVYKDGRLLDIKTTRWLYPSKVPYGSHTLQVNIYAYLLGKQGVKINRLQIQYLDLSGPSKCRKCNVPVSLIEGEFKCPECNKFIPNAHLGAMLVDVPLMEYEDIERIINERRDNLQMAIDLGSPPAKEPGFLCSYCSFKEQCAPELNED